MNRPPEPLSREECFTEIFNILGQASMLGGTITFDDRTHRCHLRKREGDVEVLIYSDLDPELRTVRTVMCPSTKEIIEHESTADEDQRMSAEHVLHAVADTFTPTPRTPHP